MTWKELKEKAKKLEKLYVNADYDSYILVSQNGNYEMKFYEYGDIGVIYDWDEDDFIIADNLTPDQMYQIMLALRQVKNEKDIL